MHDDLIQRVVDRAIDIQQIPAPTFEEGLRSEYLAQAFRDEGLTQVEIDRVLNKSGNIHGRMAVLGMLIQGKLLEMQNELCKLNRLLQ